MLPVAFVLSCGPAPVGPLCSPWPRETGHHPGAESHMLGARTPERPQPLSEFAPPTCEEHPLTAARPPLAARNPPICEEHAHGTNLRNETKRNGCASASAPQDRRVGSAKYCTLNPKYLHPQDLAILAHTRHGPTPRLKQPIGSGPPGEQQHPLWPQPTPSLTPSHSPRPSAHPNKVPSKKRRRSSLPPYMVSRRGGAPFPHTWLLDEEPTVGL